MWVAKFGGSSVKDARGIEDCARLAVSPKRYNLVILSATRNTTNLLEQSAFEQVRQRHDSILENLNLPPSLVTPLYREMDQLHPEDWAGRCALGERLSSQIFCAHLRTLTDRPVALLDAREVMITDHTTPLVEMIAEKSEKKLIPPLDKGTLVITQGFIGSTREGRTTLLGREGSDYSATLLAEAIKAKGVDIWSDVPGIFSADPNVVPTARVIPRLSFTLAEALAECGAKILFPHTLRPARRRRIPVRVRSSLQPALTGTRIAPDIPTEPGPVALVLSGDKLSLIGKQPIATPTRLPETDRSEYHCTFRVPGDALAREELLRQWHARLFAGTDQPSLPSIPLN